MSACTGEYRFSQCQFHLPVSYSHLLLMNCRFSFMESGKNVITLFKARGWTAIIADVMIDTVLWMVALGVGLLVGILGVVIGAAVGASSSATLGIGFLIGIFVGCE